MADVNTQPLVVCLTNVAIKPPEDVMNVLDRVSLYSFYAAHFILSMGVPVPGQPFVLQLRSFERNLLDDRSLCDLPFIALQHHDSAELLLKYSRSSGPRFAIEALFQR
jgi:hypothetical protein